MGEPLLSDVAVWGAASKSRLWTSAPLSSITLRSGSRRLGQARNRATSKVIFSDIRVTSAASESGLTASGHSVTHSGCPLRVPQVDMQGANDLRQRVETALREAREASGMEQH